VAPKEWGIHSHAEWKLLTPYVNSIFIKSARSFNVPAVPSTASNAAEPLPPEAEARRVYLNRARIVGHGSLFRGDVPQLLKTLPRTDADVHVYMTGPFTKPEKVLAVQPIKCKMESLRKLWSHMTTYNKPLLEHVSADLDEAAMTALQESLVEIEIENESGGGGDLAELNEELHRTDASQPSSSSGPHAASSSRVVSFIGTNLLVNEHGSSNNDVDNDVEPAAADGSARAAATDGSANEPDDCDGHTRQHGGEGGQHTTVDPITEEIATLEAIAHRVRACQRLWL
jgi:hypothetical protein